MSVIVTNYNYGHYIPSCLESLAAQTSPPDEIIVVDDGSTDGSRAILAEFPNITHIDQPNGGQAAAFNAGFSASRGDIVMFVDADDKLLPHAIEVVRRLWSTHVSALSFGLQMIDGQGHSIGQYPMEVPDRDNLDRLLNHLTIPFMPTTGNAFGRDAIEWAFPLPTERWRISADAILIRAALLSAPIRHIRQTLGAYRVHGQNNYFRSGATGPWRANRGLRDIAQAGLDLVSMTARAKKPLPTAYRHKLHYAALRNQLKAEDIAFDRGAFVAFRKRLLSDCERGRFRLYLWALTFSAVHSRALRRMLVDPRSQPRALSGFLERIRGRTLRDQLAEDVPQRGPFSSGLLPDMTVSQDPMDWLTGPEWNRDHGTNAVDLCATHSRFSFKRAWSGPAILSLDIAPRHGPLVELSVFHNGLPLGTQTVKNRQTLTFSLPENTQTLNRKDVIEIAVRDLWRGRFGVFSRMMLKAHRLKVHSVKVLPQTADPASAVLTASSPTPMTSLGDVVRKPNGETLVGEILIGTGEIVTVSVPALESPYCLAITFSKDQPKGSMTITLNDDVLCCADIGPNTQCLCEMAEYLRVFDAPAQLQFTFEPSDFLDDVIVAINDMAWVPGAAIGRYGWPTLTPGMWAGIGMGPALTSYLGEGWQHMDDGTAIMHGSAAQLTLSQAAISHIAVLRLELEPLDLAVTQDPLVLVVAAHGEERMTVQLVGPGIIDVDLTGISPDKSHLVAIDLYAARQPETQEGNPEGPQDHGGLRLSRMGLAAEATPPLRPNMVVNSKPDTTVQRQLDMIRNALSSAASTRDLQNLRNDLIVTISHLSPNAAFACLTADDLSVMATLSAKLPPHIDATSEPSLNDSDWLQGLTFCILRGPAFVTLRGVEFADLPDMTRDFAQILGSFLVMDPVFGTPRDRLADFQNHLIDVMQQARNALASSPVGSFHYLLATATVSAFRAKSLLFSDLPLRPHVEAFGQALEAKLLRQGHNLFAPQDATPAEQTAKQRIGIVLHNTEPAPETWIWRAILRKIPRRDAEIFVFFTEQNAPPKSGFENCTFVGLAGKSLSETVLALRRANVDVMILGANFYGHCFMAEVCAHRLAPRQIALSAAFPATTGLSSVDTFVLGNAVCPKSAESDYCEDVVWAPGAGQAFDLPTPPEASQKQTTTTRRRIGIDKNAILLVSGAMQDKITSDVLNTWTQILSAEPKAILVLYPFASSWQQNYETAPFMERLSATCDAHGVAMSRVRILPSIPNYEVKQILAASDIYLDSFAYSGATTTVEALQNGLPVIAMQGTTQRGHQAAGWLIEHGLEALVAKDMKDYVRLAADLAKDTARHKKLRAAIRAQHANTMRQKPFADWFESFLLPENDQADIAHRYLFHHMPKTGGTSLKRVFGDWFTLIEDYRKPWAYVMPPKQDLAKHDETVMLCGHFSSDNAPLIQRYPDVSDPSKWRKITFLRDPLERAISIHAYEKQLRDQYDQTYEPQPLGEFLRTNTGLFLTHFECDANNWRDALDTYWFIGTLERLPECLTYLADQIGKPAPVFLPHENSAERDEQASEEDIAVFRANNAIEFEIYDAVSKRLETLLGQHARD